MNTDVGIISMVSTEEKACSLRNEQSPEAEAHRGLTSDSQGSIYSGKWCHYTSKVNLYDKRTCKVKSFVYISELLCATAGTGLGTGCPPRSVK